LPIEIFNPVIETFDPVIETFDRAAVTFERLSRQGFRMQVGRSFSERSAQLNVSLTESINDLMAK